MQYHHVRLTLKFAPMPCLIIIIIRYITKKAPHARALTRNTKLVAHLDDIRYGISGARAPPVSGRPIDPVSGKERARDYEKGKV